MAAPFIGIIDAFEGPGPSRVQFDKKTKVLTHTSTDISVRFNVGLNTAVIKADWSCHVSELFQPKWF
jgi:hypothetical protein